MKTEKINTTSFFQLLTALVAVSILAVTPAFAQTDYSGQDTADQQDYSGQDTADQQMQTQQQSFDDATLNNFATTVVELGNIQNRFSEQLQGAQDQEEAVEIQQQMNDEMIDAVHNHDLDVETYNTIANQMSTDPEFQQRVEQMIQEKTN
ncbi:MAG: DUF4168 domain-containing protein [Pelovirga sp.]